MSSNDTRIEFLRRLASYGNALDQDQRRQLLDCADAIRGTDSELTAALPHLSSLSDLLTILVQPKKYADALAKITEQVKAAKDGRAAAVAEREALESSRTSLKPKLDAERSAHERAITDRTAQFDAHVAEYQKQLAVRSDALRVLEERVRADAAAVEQTKADLERRLRAVREAAA